MEPHSYFVIYKPFGILSQFSGEADTLKLLSDFPSTVYPVGRLDKDSEGLLLITDDKSLNHRLLDPKFGHMRKYLVQVEGIPTSEALAALQNGVLIQVDGKPYKTKQAKVRVLSDPPHLPDRNPPIRYRKNVPDTWIELELHEGKNRQVRKITAAVGFPTLRLVRWSIEQLDINGFEVGESRQLTRDTIYKALNISPGENFTPHSNHNRKSFRPASVKRRK
jgi:23S rRNA pseudouridine2457 synthase